LNYLATDAERREVQMAETTTAVETVTAAWVEAFLEGWIAAWNSHQLERLLELMPAGTRAGEPRSH
jgi:hypothetical protein